MFLFFFFYFIFMDYRNLLLYFRLKIRYQYTSVSKRLLISQPQLYSSNAFPGTFQTSSKHSPQILQYPDTVPFLFKSAFLQSFFSLVFSSELSFLFLFLRSLFFTNLRKKISYLNLYNLFFSLSVFSCTFQFPLQAPHFLSFLFANKFLQKTISFSKMTFLPTISPNSSPSFLYNNSLLLSVNPKILRKFWFFFFKLQN